MNTVMNAFMNEHEYLIELESKWDALWPLESERKPLYHKGEKPLTEYLSEWSMEMPEKPYLRFYGYDLSYSEFDQLTNQMANYLVSINVRPGDRVSVYMPNCPQLHIAFYGALKCGAVFVPISPMAKEIELKNQIVDSAPKVIVYFDQLAAYIEPVSAALGVKYLLATSISELKPDKPLFPLPEYFNLPKVSHIKGNDFFETLACQSHAVAGHKPALEDVAAINYTSGTTGSPKGCLHTHGDMLYTCASYLSCFGELGQDSVVLNFFPEFWVAGENGGLLFPVFNGSTLVLLTRWDTLSFMKSIEYYKVNTCGVLVDSAVEVLTHPQCHEYDLSSLTHVGCSSFIKKLNPEIRAQWQTLTGSTLVEGSYGMTETNTCDTSTLGFQDNDFDLNWSPTFVGIPVPGTQFKVCDFDTKEIVPLGEEGELCIRTPSLFKGYWNNENAHKALVRDGWFHTGDLGEISPEGYIRYIGRKKEMLKVKGMSVFPAELEAILMANSSVKACAVIGRPDSVLGQKPVAFVVFKENHPGMISALLSWCEHSMATFKIPDIREIDELPLTSTGKIKKLELQARL